MIIPKYLYSYQDDHSKYLYIVIKMIIPKYLYIVIKMIIPKYLYIVIKMIIPKYLYFVSVLYHLARETVGG